MASSPLFTFKAGYCARSANTVTPRPEPGYVYLYKEDDLLHFCWRRRSEPATQPELDLIMLPEDGKFTPYSKQFSNDEDIQSPTTGRIYVLSFQSSGQRHFFWLQSKSQHSNGDLSWFSKRDQRIGDVVNKLLAGEDEVDVQEIINGADDDGGDDMDIDDNQPSLGRRESQTGGAGANATGGDPREEGEASREGGADGGRAVSAETSAAVQNFLNSLKSGGGGGSAQAQPADRPFTTLPDLLSPSVTVSFVDSASPATIDNLCSYLPPELFLLSQESAQDPSASDPEPTPAAAQAAIEALSQEQKKSIVKRILRSPQLQQSLGSLTVALRDGGLPMIGEALGLKLTNGGVISGGSMPLGGGAAVEAFVNGVKDTVEQDEEEQSKSKSK